MASSWHKKKAKLAEEAALREEEATRNSIDFEGTLAKDLTDAAMGGGEDELFEKKLSKEEKKARAKAAREAKRKAKKKAKNGNDEDESAKDNKKESLKKLTAMKAAADGGDNGESNDRLIEDGLNHEQADRLAAEGTICTFATSRKGIDARSRDVNVKNFTLQHRGNILLDETEVILNHGNRYGLIGRNGSGKSTFLKALGARAVPIPKGIDIFFLKEEVEASDTMTALEAVMEVDEERSRLEAQAEELNQMLTVVSDMVEEEEEEGKTAEDLTDEIMETLNMVYERLDGLDAATAEVRARAILKGLGFTHEMQAKKTKDFSGGWRMRVSLARALFIQPVCLLLDEPTNHLDMEAVIWLEDYLSRWNRILLLTSHSQDFLNSVCTHTVHLTHKRKLVYYDGNYDQFVKTKAEKEENQMKQWKWEQDQIKSMKEYIARFGHGTSKNAKQAQSKEKVLQKMMRSGLTEKPEEEKVLNFQFADPGHLPPPVLAFHSVDFAYPKCEPLYTDVNFGVDLDSRIALVGPNGAGKTTLVKLMSGELLPTKGDIRPHGHLKLGRFTQHFVDVLNLEQTPLEFFDTMYPGTPREDQRKYLGRFGLSGKMQVQKMGELSDGQKSRVVFAKLGRDVPHILLLDEPTNHLDMESIDALAKAVNSFQGGLVLVSHDMRLIAQVAKEIWICDNKTITPYKGDIQNFKMDMRKHMGIDEDGGLRGDASVKKTEKNPKPKPAAKKEEPKLEVVSPPMNQQKVGKSDKSTAFDDIETSMKKSLPKPTVPVVEKPGATSSAPARGKYIPPHLRKKMSG